MLMFILLLPSTKIDNGVKLAHLVVGRMFYSIVLCPWMGFRPIGMCLDYVGVYWTSEPPAVIRDRCLFETGRLIVLRYMKRL